MGIKFNIPRVLLLMIFGGLVGYIIYKGVNLDIVSESGTDLFRYGYLFIGSFLVILGLYNLAHSLEEKEDIKEGVCHPLFRVVKDKKFPVVWGSVFSLVCVGEAAIAFETLLLAGAASTFFSNSLSAVSMGATVMLFFGIGLSIPMVIYTGLGAKYTADKSRKLLNWIRIVSSILMITFGIVAIVSIL